MSQAGSTIIAGGPGSGTVTSISAGTGITLTPNPITTTGTVALTIPVTIADGGTNATSMTNADGIVYFDGTRLVTTAVGTASQILTSNGIGVAPTFQNAPSGGTTMFTADTGTAAPSAGNININGDGINTLTAASGDTVVVTLKGITQHAVQVGGASSSLVSLSLGTSGQVLTSNGAGSDPSFQAPAASSISITGNSGGALTGNAFTFTGGTTGLTFAGAGSTETLGGTLVVANGGTGSATLTNHGVLVGAGTSAITQLAVGSTGTVLIGTTGSDPSFSATPTVTSITISNAPVAGTDGTNKTYVDAIAAGLDFKDSCYAASTANLNATYLNGVAGVGATLINAGSLAAFSIDGQSPPINSRILIKDQTSQFQNGIYSLTTVGTGAVAWVLTRTTDYNQPSEIQPGDIVPVQFGTVNANTLWLQTATVATIGTDSIVFTKFLGQGITTITGNTGGALSGGNITFTGGTTGLTFAGSGTTETLGGTLAIANGGTNATSMATTDGVVYYDGTRLVTTSAGTAAQVLTSNGAGVAPTYQAIPASGAMVLIQTQVVSAVSAVTFTTGISSTYTNYVLIMSNVTTAAGSPNYEIQLSSNGGSSYINSGYFSGLLRWNYNASTVQNNVTSTSALLLTEGNVGYYANGTYNINSLTNAGYPMISGNATWSNGSGSINDVAFGTYGTQTAMNALQVIPTSSTITGNFSLYGIAK